LPCVLGEGGGGVAPKSDAGGACELCPHQSRKRNVTGRMTVRAGREGIQPSQRPDDVTTDLANEKKESEPRHYKGKGRAKSYWAVIIWTCGSREEAGCSDVMGEQPIRFRLNQRKGGFTHQRG